MNFNRITLALGVLGSVFFILTACQSKTSSTTDTITPDTARYSKGTGHLFPTMRCMSQFQAGWHRTAARRNNRCSFPEWIENFIKDPKMMIESGDERSHQLFEKFKTIMPSFARFSDEELHGIISFLGTKKAA